MHIYYVDESGNLGERVFVLAAMCVSASARPSLTNAVGDLKAKWFPWCKPEDLELHASDIRHGKGVFRRLKQRRFELLVELADVIAQNDVGVLAVVVDNRELPAAIEKDEQLYRMALWALLDMVGPRVEIEAEGGLMVLDTRSPLHSSLQDRRLLDAYLEYTSTH